jgi:hypothetical protein
MNFKFFKPKLNLMKKMNLFFLSRVKNGMNYRKGLMIFTMLFLFGFGFNTVSAQYVSTEVAITKLQDVSKDLTKNWQALQNSDDQLAISRGNQKLLIVSRMLTNLKEGATVKNTVEKFIGLPNQSDRADYGMAIDGPKNGFIKNWLNDEILKMLKL